MLIVKTGEVKSISNEINNNYIVGEPTLEDAKAKYEADLANGEMVGSVELVHHRMLQSYRNLYK